MVITANTHTLTHSTLLLQLFQHYLIALVIGDAGSKSEERRGDNKQGYIYSHVMNIYIGSRNCNEAKLNF